MHTYWSVFHHHIETFVFHVWSDKKEKKISVQWSLMQNKVKFIWLKFDFQRSLPGDRICEELPGKLSHDMLLTFWFRSVDGRHLHTVFTAGSHGAGNRSVGDEAIGWYVGHSAIHKFVGDGAIGRYVGGRAGESRTLFSFKLPLHVVTMVVWLGTRLSDIHREESRTAPTGTKHPSCKNKKQ